MKKRLLILLLTASISLPLLSQSAQDLKLSEVEVFAAPKGNSVDRRALIQTERISRTGLAKMACCNVAESFENSASVTTGYSDAVTGVRQIRMLGLSGSYTQLLDEGRPMARGLSAASMLQWVPGSWLSGISVSKGVSSVVQGHEAITGQINLDFRKPTDRERLFANLYVDDRLRLEANLSSAFRVGRRDRVHTILLAHASADSELGKADMNHDGFRDMPDARQFSLMNRWLCLLPLDMQLRFGLSATAESRLGGQTAFTDRSFYANGRVPTTDDPYGSVQTGRHTAAYLKLALPIGGFVADPDSVGDDKQSSLALTADFEYTFTDLHAGMNHYRGSENGASLQLLLNHYFSYHSSLSAGYQFRYNGPDERWSCRDYARTADVGGQMDRTVLSHGLYAEYTLSPSDRLTIQAGLRADVIALKSQSGQSGQSAQSGQSVGSADSPDLTDLPDLLPGRQNQKIVNQKIVNAFTPRLHVRWQPRRSTVVRASGGLGCRVSNPLAENPGIMATGRTVVADTLADLLERAFNGGVSLSQTFDLGAAGAATLSVEYFRTQFFNSVLVDQEMYADRIMIYSTRGRSFTDNWQADLSWTPVERLDVLLTARYTRSRCTLNRADGTQLLVERPLMSRFKGLLNVQYATKFRRWVFDATAQLNGRSRIPSDLSPLPSDLIPEQSSPTRSLSPVFPLFYAQVTRRVKTWDFYLGCENIAGYTQKDPIRAADNPWSTDFNSTLVWGPLMGRKFYAGLRWNLF